MYFMKSIKAPLFFVMACVSVLSFSSCSKNDSKAGNKARMQVYLTDDTGPYQQVIIDVDNILINYSNDTAKGWTPLANVNAGSYDILRLINDKDTILADAEVNTGRIEQIRLVLGSDNFVKLNTGQVIRLETPSAQQSGLKL